MRMMEKKWSRPPSWTVGGWTALYRVMAEMTPAGREQSILATLSMSPSKEREVQQAWSHSMESKDLYVSGLDRLRRGVCKSTYNLVLLIFV